MNLFLYGAILFNGAMCIGSAVEFARAGGGDNVLFTAMYAAFAGFWIWYTRRIHYWCPEDR